MLSRFMNYVRGRMFPVKVFHVEMLVYYRLENRPIGNFVVTVEARTKARARTRAMEMLTLTTGRVQPKKEKSKTITTHNGHKL